MPKRIKKKKNQDDAEARPPSLTLASFMNAVPGISVQETPAESASAQLEVAPSTSIVTEESPTDNEAPSFLVRRTKKGRLPIAYEKRAKGKRVTVLGNVSGDAEVLLHELKKRVGAGGVAKEDTVEIQGDHRKAVEEFLTGHPWVKR